MIRKPDAREFRESGTVSAMRDARTFAVEGGRSIGQQLAGVAVVWFAVVTLFGVVMTAALGFGTSGLTTAIGAGVAWFIYTRQRRARWRISPAAPSRGHVPRQAAAAVMAAHAHYPVSAGAIGRRTAALGTPAILLFVVADALPFTTAVVLVGIVLLALAILTAARLWGDRTLLRFNGQTLTVRGLLGQATMRWDDVDDVAVRTSSPIDLAALFTSGARRNIEVTARINRLGGPERLLVAYPLLDLDPDGFAALIGTLLTMQAGSSDRALAALDGVVSPPQPSPAVSLPAATVGDVAAMPFDPDAIMARYLAEREQVVAAARPDAAPPSERPTFGRKTTRN